VKWTEMASPPHDEQGRIDEEEQVHAQAAEFVRGCDAVPKAQQRKLAESIFKRLENFQWVRPQHWPTLRAYVRYLDKDRNGKPFLARGGTVMGREGCYVFLLKLPDAPAFGAEKRKETAAKSASAPASITIVSKKALRKPLATACFGGIFMLRLDRKMCFQRVRPRPTSDAASEAVQ